MKHAPVLFLLGPTACGKTATSIQAAKQLDAEIISVDSALVYKGMDVGTAKPDMEERAGVLHHLIDVCTPDDAYSVARFCSDALATIDEIASRGKRAILTGGTMLYFNALEKGIAPLPNADKTVREALSLEAAKIGWPGMHAKLAEIDPIAANRIHPNDPQRLQRALEVYELTGKALSELQKDTKPLLAIAPVKLALLPESRAWLHERIGRRFGIMLEDGLIDEVRELKSAYNLDKNMPSMRSVGYRQVWQYLSGELDQNTMVEKSETATRQLAKRQITWIRSMENLHRISCDELSLDDQIDAIVSTYNDNLNT